MDHGQLWICALEPRDPVEPPLDGTDHDGAPVVGLTTVHQDVAEHGARAARTVIDMLTDRECSLERQNAPIKLIERMTTAPPPG